MKRILKARWQVLIASPLLGGSGKSAAKITRSLPPRNVRILVAVLLALTQAVWTIDLAAKPRPPLPPFPELSPLLVRADFDEPFWSHTETPESINAAYGDLVESWSGYALRRAGKTVTPFIVPAMNEFGHTNVNCSEGAIRLWVKPYWSSASVPNGSGPGVNARLVELSVVDLKDAVPVWSVNVSPDGAALFLTVASQGGVEDLLQVQIDWVAGEWHLVSLNYGPKGTTLSIDGKLAGEGGGTLAVPATVAALSVGSTLTGGDPVGGELDEVCAFARPLLPLLAEFYYGAFSHQAALGPITLEEEAAQRELAAKRKAERDLQSGGQQSMMMMQSLTNCPTNAVVWLTNVTRVLTNNPDAVVTFDLVGGDSGLLYDIFATTNIVTTNCPTGTNCTNCISESTWTWLERGPSCATYQYTNQSAAYAFYVVGTPVDSDGDGLTDAYELLVSKTDPHNPDTDGDGMPDGWEVSYGLNPLSNDASGDLDGDGFSNLEEYWLGTKPNDAPLFKVIITQPKGTSNLP